MPTDKIIALAGNPNVGKSTVFNALTGLNQHTGNWPGKTVAGARGTYHAKDADYILVDLPGTYSLMARSAEEEVARDFLLSGEADATVVVCDATCLERNLNLVLQTLEITPKVVVCVNLMDEAKKKGVRLDLDALSRELGVPVVATSARSGKGLTELMKAVRLVSEGSIVTSPPEIRYPSAIEDALSRLMPVLQEKLGDKSNTRWLALRLLEGEHFEALDCEDVRQALEDIKEILSFLDFSGASLHDRIVSSIVLRAEEICLEAVPRDCCGARGFERDRKLDKILTSKLTGIPVMLLLLCGIFWLTITGANYPSQILSDWLFALGERISAFLTWIGAPWWIQAPLVDGVYRVLAWVVSVMLPPMAIFFPLFTLLEDFGYLPRVAFNLDYQFKKAKTCGKQALTMCMVIIIL